MGESEDVRDRLEELQIVDREGALVSRVCAEDPVWNPVPADENTDAARHSVILQQRGWTESLLGPKVGDDDRLVPFERVSCVRLESGPEGRAPDQPLSPTNSLPQQQGLAPWKQFEDPAGGDLQRLNDARRRRSKERILCDSRKGEIAQFRNGRLLTSSGS